MVRWTIWRRAAARSRALSVPAMRKDFLVDGYQVLEGRAAGASGVLAILRMLPRGDLEELIDTALDLDMFVLLEAFDAARHRAGARAGRSAPGASRAAAGGREFPRPGHAEGGAGPARCAGRIAAPQVRRVAESGVATAADAARVAAAGYDLALVGSALMSAQDPAQLAGAMLAAGRAAVTARTATAGAGA